jgi:uncharacterized protein (DUF362 family)
MAKFSRRDFLRMLAAGTGALSLQQLLAACGIKPASVPVASTVPASMPSPTSMTSATAAPSIPDEAPPPLPSEAPDLVVARGSDPETIVRRALAALGGMERFVSKNASVVVKPNICVAYHSYEYAATTNPWVVAALVKMCLEAGARSVQVMDMPFGGGQKEAYVRSGISEQVLAAGGEMISMSRLKYVAADIPGGQDLKQTRVYEDVLKADVLINVPIAKTHGLAGLTLGMKNLLGVIQDRPYMHTNLGQRVADLTSLLRPELTVVDAVRILTANGPSGGNLDDVKELDTVIASADIVAADSYATGLFNRRPEEITYISAATAMGLGRSDLQNLRIEEIAA